MNNDVQFLITIFFKEAPFYRGTYLRRVTEREDGLMGRWVNE
jgi:hypothetical protein